MPELIKAKESFRFHTRLHLSELTGLKATNIKELLNIIKTVAGSSIYHHTHRFLQLHQYLSPEPPNDFAYWTSEILGEKKLGEALASIDIIQFGRIRDLRDKIAKMMEDYLIKNPSAEARFTDEDRAFHFMKSRSFVIATDYTANDLKEFIDILEKITVDSIYFHIFESRLRLEKGTNDFSNWIEDSIGDKKLADELSRLDPYTYTLEELRNTIIRRIKRRL